MASKRPSGLQGKRGESLSFEPHPKLRLPDNSTRIIAFLALIIALISLFINITSPPAITDEDRAEIRAIAQDLREIQQKEIVLTSPLKTTVVIDKSIPISRLFPEGYTLKIDETVPLSSTVAATSNTGQIVNFEVLDDLRIKAEVPIASMDSQNQTRLRINEEIPIESRFSATLKVNAVYGKEFNDLINRIEKISEKKGT